VSYLQAVQENKVRLVCNACRRPVTLDDVTGDEPYVPEYRPPAGAI